jgi:hypothetical protein
MFSSKKYTEIEKEPFYNKGDSNFYNSSNNHENNYINNNKITLDRASIQGRKMTFLNKNKLFNRSSVEFIEEDGKPTFRSFHSSNTNISSSQILTPKTTSPIPSNIMEHALYTLRSHKLPKATNIKHHRLIDRDGPFYQSRGKMKIRKRIKRSDWAALYSNDLFHTLVDLPTYRMFIILMGSYIFLILIFAILYYFIAVFYDCDMGMIIYICI